MNNPEEILNGKVSDISFANPETGFTVLEIESGGKLYSAVGEVPEIAVGESVNLTGRWVVHKIFGRQFKIETCRRKLPESAADMLRYLSAGTVKGIGPKMASKIVEKFGEQTFDIIKNHPEKLAEIKGITRDTALKMSEEFTEKFALTEIIINFSRYGFSGGECIEFYKAYGSGAFGIFEKNPYLFCNEPLNLRFERIDQIACSLDDGSNNAENRIRAGISYILKHNLGNGHTCLPRTKTVPLAANLLDCSLEIIEQNVDNMIKNEALFTENMGGRDFLFLPSMYFTETKTAKRISVMLKFPPPKGWFLADDKIAALERKYKITYGEKQKEAIRVAIQKGLLILTGGPGTGKTTTLNAIIDVYENDGLKVALAAPTGRAAKRMSEITGREAKTIHRLLEVEWVNDSVKRFKRNVTNPLECDALIIDELSMVDIDLFSALIDAVKLNCRIIMVGDNDQLPAVGAGNVLSDLIECGLVPVVFLDTIFRQAMESLIVMNSHRIVSGEYPVLDDVEKDFFFIRRNNVFACAETLIQLYTERLPAAYGYDPVKDIQILCPSKKGPTGTFSVNSKIQAIVNPPSPEKTEYNYAGRVFRTGDKVMQVKNNYDIIWFKDGEQGEGVFNGDIGFIQTMSHEKRVMTIVFDDKTAVYPFEYFEQLEIAYAVTVHKSQGSEYEAVIIPVCNVLEKLAYRNLLYTGVTRAKNKLILVGTREDVEKMVDNDKKIKRYSSLKHFLIKNAENTAGGKNVTGT